MELTDQEKIMALSWLKKGEESKAIEAKEQVEAEQRKLEQGKMWRWFIKEGEEADLTFVDGELSKEGFLVPPRYYEHNLYIGGKYNNFFVCPEKTNPDSGDKCPICEDPQERPSLVALFTVIDHREWKSEDGKKVYRDRPRLLVAKPLSFEMLNKLAMTLGGLARRRFRVSRQGDKSAAIGSMFIPMGDPKPLEELQAMYMEVVKDPKTNHETKKTIFLPANYEEEIVYRDGATLRKLGFGKPTTAGMSTFVAPQNPAGGQPAAAPAPQGTVEGNAFAKHL